MWSSFHVRQDVELIGAARNEDYLHWTGIPCVNVEPKDENVGLKGGLPNYDELAYRVLLSKAKTDAVRYVFVWTITRKIMSPYLIKMSIL